MLSIGFCCKSLTSQALVRESKRWKSLGPTRILSIGHVTGHDAAAGGFGPPFLSSNLEPSRLNIIKFIYSIFLLFVFKF